LTCVFFVWRSAPPQVIVDAEASAARWRRIRKVNGRPKSPAVHPVDGSSVTLPRARSVSPVRGNYTADSVPPTRAEMLVAMQRKVLHADSASRKAAVAVRRRSITGLNATSRSGGSPLDGDGPSPALSALSAGSAAIDLPAPQMPVLTAVPPTPFERTDSGVPVFSVSLAELMSTVPETPAPQTKPGTCKCRAGTALTDVGPPALQTDTSMSSPMSTTSAPPPPISQAQTRLWSSLHSVEQYLPGRSAVVRSPTHSMIPQTPHTPGGSGGWSTGGASANHMGSTGHVSPSSSGRRSWAEREAAKHMQSLTQCVPLTCVGPHPLTEVTLVVEVF